MFVPRHTHISFATPLSPTRPLLWAVFQLLRREVPNSSNRPWRRTNPQDSLRRHRCPLYPGNAPGRRRGLADSNRLVVVVLVGILDIRLVVVGSSRLAAEVAGRSSPFGVVAGMLQVRPEEGIDYCCSRLVGGLVGRRRCCRRSRRVGVR